MALVQLPDGRTIEVPDTGLIGSEQALQAGLRGTLSTIGTGAGIARADLAETQRLAGRAIQRGVRESGAAIGEGVARLDPFATGGGAAFDVQTALSGALGPEAQREAFENFVSSPGQEFLVSEAEQASLRNAAATGGLGGGRIRQELERQAIGFAARDFENQFGRLGTLSQIGAGAAGQQAALFGERGRIAAGLRGEQAGITTRLGEGRAGVAERAGVAGAGAILGTGRDIAGGRTRAGEGIAASIGRTGTALADLVSRGGAGISDILSRGTGSLADILATAGAAAGGSREELATILANIATGSASQRASLPSLPSLQPKRGILSDIGRAAEGAGAVIGAF